MAYFSYSGNTENGAQIIADMTGGNLFEIQMEHPYNGNIYEVSQADLNHDVHPALASHVENMEQYDLAGKTIVPFCTHGGSRFGSSISTTKEFCPDSAIVDGYETSGSLTDGDVNEISEWLNGLNLKIEKGKVVEMKKRIFVLFKSSSGKPYDGKQRNGRSGFPNAAR